MNRLQRKTKARLLGIVPSHADATALVAQSGDLAIVKRGTLRSAVMRCPDGCGEIITLNLDPRTDAAWRLYRSKKGVTLFPSVWRTSGCKSHFVLWNSAISWMDLFEVQDAESEERNQLESRVYAILKADAFLDFVHIADALDEIPWAVLDACRHLVAEHRAIAGSGPAKSSFKRIDDAR